MNLFLQVIPLQQSVKKDGRVPRCGSRKIDQIEDHICTKKTGVKQKQSKRIRSQWNYIEARNYVEFLMSHQDYYELSVNQRRNFRINVLMSEAIKTRSPKQCYSHHQKMIKKYGSLQAVIAKFKYLLRTSSLQSQINATYLEIKTQQQKTSLNENEEFLGLLDFQQKQQRIKSERLLQMKEFQSLEQLQNLHDYDLCI